MPDANKPPLSPEELDLVRGRLTAFARWVAASSGYPLDGSDRVSDETLLGVRIVWSAVHYEVCRGRDWKATLPAAEATARTLLIQEFRLSEAKATELAHDLRELQTKWHQRTEADASSDPAVRASPAATYGVGDPVVAGAWVDLARGEIVYEAWRATPGLAQSQYSEILSSFSGGTGTMQAQSQSRGCALLLASLASLAASAAGSVAALAVAVASM